MNYERRRQVILLSGYARSGKDTFASALTKLARRPIRRMAFADRLKLALTMAASTVGIDVDYMDEAEKIRDRDLLLSFGTAMRRRDPYVFAKFVQKAVFELRSGTLLVTDLRYLDEYLAVREVCAAAAVDLRLIVIQRAGTEPNDELEKNGREQIMDNAFTDFIVNADHDDLDKVLAAAANVAKHYDL